MPCQMYFFAFDDQRDKVDSAILKGRWVGKGSSCVRHESAGRGGSISRQRRRLVFGVQIATKVVTWYPASAKS